MIELKEFNSVQAGKIAGSLATSALRPRNIAIGGGLYHLYKTRQMERERLELEKKRFEAEQKFREEQQARQVKPEE